MSLQKEDATEIVVKIDFISNYFTRIQIVNSNFADTQIHKRIIHLVIIKLMLLSLNDFPTCYKITSHSVSLCNSLFLVFGCYLCCIL